MVLEENWNLCGWQHPIVTGPSLPRLTPSRSGW